MAKISGPRRRSKLLDPRVARLPRALPPEEELIARPTLLAGITYRSRLEARWRLWFSALEIPVEYEPEPIQLHGRAQWSDFWAPTLGCWIEVKPGGTPPDEAMAQAVAEQTGSPLLWLAGSPWPGDYRCCLMPGDRAPIPNLRWALGRRDHSQLWLADPAAVLAIRLAPPLTGPLDWEMAQGMEFPLFDCALLREAYRHASTFQFG